MPRVVKQEEVGSDPNFRYYRIFPYNWDLSNLQAQPVFGPQGLGGCRGVYVAVARSELFGKGGLVSDEILLALTEDKPLFWVTVLDLTHGQEFKIIIADGQKLPAWYQIATKKGKREFTGPITITNIIPPATDRRS